MSTCPICTSDITAPTAGPYFGCAHCGCWFQSPMPPKVYHGPAEPGVDVMPDGERAVNVSLAKWLFTTVMCSRRGVTLDIGSKIPVLASALGDLECMPYALDAVAPQDEPHVKGIVGDFESINPADLPADCDLITLVHTFEHFYDTLAALRKLRGLLSDRGRVHPHA